MRSARKGRARVSIAACLVVVAAAAEGAGIVYLGPGAGPGSARVQVEGGRVIELRPGEPSELGDLQSADENEMVIERGTTAEERRRYREAGAPVPDVDRIHVRRDPPPAEVSFAPAE